MCACELDVSFNQTIGLFFYAYFMSMKQILKETVLFPVYTVEPSAAPCSKITLYSQISWPDHDRKLANITFQCSYSNCRVILRFFQITVITYCYYNYDYHC